MSFSQDVKTELCRARLEGRDSRVALLSGVVSAIGKIEENQVVIVSESSDVIRLVMKQLKATYGIATKLESSSSSRLTKKRIYALRFEMTDGDIDLLFSPASHEHLPFEASTNYYLRGLFLGLGSITDPSKGYHLELVFKDVAYAERTARLIQREFRLMAKVLPRKNDYICYLKGAENISDFLTVVGSVQLLLEFENTRAYKQVFNNINRALNCDSANIERSRIASVEQIEAIEYLKSIGKLEQLGDKYVEVAELRLQNPSMELSALAAMMDPPLTKSGFNHRMRKIMSTATKYKSR